MSKTILVTGGAGFIGSHLCQKLLNQGNKVICLDNFFTGSKANIKDFLNNQNFELVEHDVVVPIFLAAEQIYHLACPASPVRYQFNPVETVRTNVIGTLNMLDLAKKTKARILQASTSEIYGDPLEHPQKESYWGNVNPLSARACYSQDTEVLTEEGWKFFRDITYEDNILTLTKNGYMEYQKPSEIIQERYVGELIAFKNSKIDLLVTPNHKMYLKRRDRKGFELVPAFDTIGWNHAEMKKSAEWKGEERKYFYLPPVENNKYGNVEKIKIDVWLEFFGYYISEGCVHLRKRGRVVKGKKYETIDYNILIAQDRKNKYYRQKISRCLSKMPFTFFSSDDHQFRICNKQLAMYLIQFGKAREKYVPKEIKNLSRRQLKILFNALMLGDGAKDGRAFYSSSYRLAGDFQEILLKLGMAGSIGKKDKRKPHPIYQVYILTDKKKDFLTPLYPKRKVERYDGFVFCVNVPNHIIYVRRSGKTLFCGNCYDEGKRCAETLCMDYHRQHGVDIRIVRIFNTYGPNMDINDGRVISNFIVQALKNQPITIYGAGSQTRSFQYIDDLIEGMIRMMENVEGFVGPVNLGNPNEVTIDELAKKILELIPESESEIIYCKLPEDDPRRRQPDVTLAKEKLNWEAKVKLEAGLIKTIEYFKKAI
mgnify:CR=1 FL=1